MKKVVQEKEAKVKNCLQLNNSKLILAKNKLFLLINLVKDHQVIHQKSKNYLFKKFNQNALQLSPTLYQNAPQLLPN